MYRTYNYNYNKESKKIFVEFAISVLYLRWTPPQEVTMELDDQRAGKQCSVVESEVTVISKYFN